MVATVTLNFKQDTNCYKELLEGIKELSKVVRVGIFDPEQATKAYANEHGIITEKGFEVPRRSVFENTMNVCGDDIIQKATEKLTEITTKSARGALMTAGQRSLRGFKDAFLSRGFGEWEPNAPWTIQKKGRDDPLIDTGAMKNSFEFVIVGGNE